jgi:pyruvate-ferredoxin/flavodoxin oxidoreductase
VLADYPEIADLALVPEENVDLSPAGSLAVRIHSVGGWGAITMGKNLTMSLFELAGLQVKSNPKYGSEKKGQPTTFYGVFAHHPIRQNCELRHVDVVLSPDPNVFKHSNALAGLAEGGLLVIQAAGTAEALWASLPAWAQQIVRDRSIRVFALDAFRIARDETDVADLQFRMQGAAFQGAFFRVAPVMEREGLGEDALFATIRKQLEKKFGHRGTTVVEDNFRVIRRGFDEVREIDWRSLPEAPADGPRLALTVPWYLDRAVDTAEGIADPFRFMHQVCAVYADGQDPLADPFAALSAIPAATGIFRDMTGIRFEVPRLVAERCTGCGQCWTQCPDAAIPGLVTEIRDVLRAAMVAWEGNGGVSAVLRSHLDPLAEGCRRLLREDEDFTSFATVLGRAWEGLAGDLGLPADERAALDEEMDGVIERIAEFPLARTAPFFTVPERRQAGSGGLLAVTINPNACKGCNLCVEVCPDDALVTTPQDESLVALLRRNWKRWEQLPDTPDHFLQVSDWDEGIGVLHTLLLKKKNYHSMVGGDGACMGCGEKTGMHLVVATIEAAMRPRVAAFATRLERLVAALEDKAGELMLTRTDLEELATTGGAHLDVEVPPEARDRLLRIARTRKKLADLHWRYTSGPAGRGRASLGIINSTGCSSVWGSTYPYNPYPYPWANHLFQDSPSVAVGVFEGLMRKMSDGFVAVRTAELELDDAYDPAVHDAFFDAFDWRELSDEEFRLCPPVLAVGGDGAMLDIGFQNVSRLMASGKPIRVVVLDTQVYSNTGGQACTSGFKGQVSDMAEYGAARHGKEEHRKEMSLIAMAHRSSYVLQSSQALPAHLVGGVLRGLGSRRPAIFTLYTPCQAEHGLPDSASASAARLALESRAFPFLVYDPDAGTTFAERLSLEGNPEPEADFPSYELAYVADDGAEASLILPVTTADWAATEPRFGRHFREISRAAWSEAQVPFHEYLGLAPAVREGKVPFLWVIDGDRRLQRKLVAEEMVELAEDRLDLWDELRELAGVKVSQRVRDAIVSPLERRLRQELDDTTKEYELKLAELKARYPQQIVRRIAQVLVEGGALATVAGGGFAPAWPPARPRPVPAPPPPAAPEPPALEAVPAPAPAAEPEADGLEPWIDSELCTTCNECTNLNPKMFAYNENKQAYIKDPKAGPYSDLVKAAERCSARVIHPGTPLDPDEPDLAKWVKRAEPFN